MNKSNTQYWNTLFSVKTNFSECWKHCNSYCCTWNSEYFKFSLIKNNQSTLVLMKREFDFLKKIDKLQNGFLETAHERVFEFGKSKRAIFVTVTCSQRGNCSLPEYKPLLCKFYPFLPKLNEKTGKISGFYFASVLDLYWSKLSLPHPCYFLNHRMSRLDAILRKFEPFVNDPYVIFYLKAAELLSVRLVKDLKLKYPSIFKIGPDLFFSKWEGLYLSGRIINLNEYRAELKNLYDRLVNRFGSFEI